MPHYTCITSRTAAVNVTVGNVNVPASPLRRLRVYDLLVGAEAAGDNPFSFHFQRTTANGTRTAVTNKPPVNPADGAATFEAGENHSGEPTYTANTILRRIPLNQRATMRWVAAREEGMLVVPAVQDSGIGCRTPVAGAVAVSVDWGLEEV